MGQFNDVLPQTQIQPSTEELKQDLNEVKDLAEKVAEEAKPADDTSAEQPA